MSTLNPNLQNGNSNTINTASQMPEQKLDIESEVAATSSKKRRKNTVSKVKSCAECRRLKLRCDRQVPCNNCVRRGTGSICPDGALKTARGRTLILESNEALHNRIASLESALNDVTAKSGGHPLLTNAYHLENLGESPSGGSPEDCIVIPEGQLRQDPDEVQKADDDDDDNGEEQLGHLQIDSGNVKSSRFFGDASSLFLVEPRETAPGPSSGDGLYTFRSGWVDSFVFERDSALKSEYTLRALASQLPPRNEAERLAEIHFENVAWGTCVLDKRVFFIDIMNHCYTGQLPDAQRLAVLYLVLALGALFDPLLPAGANNNAYCRDLFALGRGCLTMDSSGSIIYVQAIHLMVTWLTNGGRVVSSYQSTWPLLGMAMRVVQALGLHRDGSHFDLPQDEVAERRRVFWEIFSYDINHAVTSARPRSMTSATYDVLIPSTMDGEDFYHEARYRLSNQIFCKINDMQSAISPTPYEKVLDIDRELRKFMQQLPKQLTMEEVSTPEKAASLRKHSLQRHAMRFQCNIGFLFLHRGWFARALLEEPEEPLRSKYSPSFVGCLEACKLILGVVQRLSVDIPFICQRRWMFLFHSFTACACLAAAVIRAPQSMLAQSSLVALDEGIKLFEEAGKNDELEMLLPLRDTARRSFSHSGRARPANDEDLALLGKGYKRATSATKSTPPSVPPDSTSAAERRPLSNSPSLAFSAASLVQTEVLESMSNPSNESVGEPLRPLDSFDWYNGGSSITEFDFDAFLGSFGINGSLNDLFTDGRDHNATAEGTR